MIHLIQVVRQHSVVEVDELSEVGIHNECLVAVTIICGPRKLQSDHLEFVFGSGSGSVHVEFDVVNVNNDKLSQALPRTYWSELVLVVGRAIDLEGAHRVDIEEVHGGCEFVDKNERSDAAQGFGSFGREDDEIVPADWSQLENVCVLEMIRAVLLVVRDQLPCVLVFCNEVSHHELDQAV